jgi:hypothetical protein
VRIGNADVTVIQGQVDWSFPSDGRFKYNVSDLDLSGLNFVNRLRPVTYQFDRRTFEEHLTQNFPDSIRQQRLARFDPDNEVEPTQTGFIAQEIEQVCRDLNYSFSGLHVPESAVDNYSLAYGSFVPLLVKAIQEQQVVIQKMEERIAQLESNAGKSVSKVIGDRYIR